MYKDTITLFNRVPGTDGDSWIPTVITGVNVNADKGLIVKQYGEASADNAVLNVRYRTDGGKIMVGDKQWLPPKDWLRAESKEGCITFAGGTRHDFFWKGEWTGADVIYDDNYGDMTFYDYMLANYDCVYAVTGWTILSVIPHFEIAGR